MIFLLSLVVQLKLPSSPLVALTIIVRPSRTILKKTMARLRDSRSPTPAGSQQSSRRHRRDEDRRDRDRYRDRDRRDFGRDARRRSRSRSPHDVRRCSEPYYSHFVDNYVAQRRNRDRDRDRDHDFRRRDRSPERRDDDYYRAARDRRRSRDRPVDRERDRSPEPRRRRSRDRDGDRDHRSRRDDSHDRGRGRREGTADSHPRSRRGDSRERGPAPSDAAKTKTSDVRFGDPLRSTAKTNTYKQAELKPKQATAQSDADKKVERLAKLAAWKKKQEEKEKQKEPTPGGTRKLLAEMDEKANTAPSNAKSTGASPAPASPADAQVPSPVAPYAGKFDPKAIAKKSAPKAQTPSAAPKLGVVVGQPSTGVASATKTSSGKHPRYLMSRHTANWAPEVSALPQRRAKTSGFGFHKQNAEAEKVSQKRKLILDEEEISDRKLAKLPSLPLGDVDDTPYENQDEEDDDDADAFVGDEEEEAAAARAAQERREERIAQENAQQAAEMQVDQVEEKIVPDTNGNAQAAQPGEAMEVDQDDDVDPLDAFMTDLEAKPVAKRPLKPSPNNQNQNSQEPEAYFSDDEFDYRNENVEPDSFLAIAAKARKKKDIPSVDYSKIEIDPVRKNFWVEPAELAEMTEAELADLRIELDGIKVSGKDVPKPVQKWSQCALSRKTLDIIDSLGFEKPTPIQMQAFPAIMSGRDVIGVAKTGSGKTLAFLLPMF